MATNKASFSSPKQSIRWAWDALNEFEAICQQFFGDHDLGKYITEIDPDTGDNVFKFKFTNSFPELAPRRATEALLLAKHSFDQSMFVAASKTGRASGKTLYYPWSTGPKDLDIILDKRGVPQPLWDTIRGHHPYPGSDAYTGGDNLIRQLATIVNDKHTVGIAVAGKIAGSQQTIHVGYLGMNEGHYFRARNPRWNAEKNEIEIFRWKGDANPGNQGKLAFRVVLDDSRLPEPEDVYTSLRAFIAKAQSVQESLEARCVELGHL